ncbi:MAG: SDR family oxidoreductase [Saccharofermentanales bacterium]|jgi:NAD(P)-dependent dehydrogenase (short-subunit alcohol dehydrogenase family)|nr:SDR family oxidoreductase [Clostridiaceae bacterium]
MKIPFHVDLAGKITLVTGGSGVLGSQFCRALAACGAKVAILNRTLENGQKLAREIGDNAMAVSADVLSRASLEKARDIIESKWGPVSILINGAGGNNPLATTDDEQYDQATTDVKNFFKLDYEGIRFVFDLNFLGTLLPTQVFAEQMAGMPGACIINVSSMGAYLPLTKVMAYSGAKAAVSNFTQWLATYFAKSGIRVNAIAPGFFVGEQNYSLLFDKNGHPTPRTEKILAATPMGRFGESEELIGTLLYLVSPEASGFVTGVVIPVDGGYTAYSGV